MAEEFAALDVETANAALSSICQIGVVLFADGEITSSWQSLVNPEDYFSPVNVAIHGIDEDTVRDAPRFSGLAPHMASILSDRVVAIHSPFDRLALKRVHEKYALPQLDCIWLDTAKVCQRAWTQFARRGYGSTPRKPWTPARPRPAFGNSPGPCARSHRSPAYRLVPVDSRLLRLSESAVRVVAAIGRISGS